MDHLLYTSTLNTKQWAVDLLQYTATLPLSSMQWISCSTLPHFWGAVSSGPPSVHRHIDVERWGAVGSGSPSVHGRTARDQWAADHLLCTATLLMSSEQWISSNAVPNCWGAVGNGSPSPYCHTAGGQWILVVWSGVVWRGVAWRGTTRRGAVRCGAVWYRVVCQRRCYQMPMAGMPGIHPMQTGRPLCLNTRCV